MATFGSSTVAGHSVIIFGFACNDSNCATSALAITLSASTTGAGNTAVACGGNPYRVNSNIQVIGCWIMDVVTASTAFTVTATGGTPFFLTSYVSEWTGAGAAATAFDVGGANFTTSTSTTASTSAGTTTNSTDLVIGLIELGAANAVTPGSGFLEISENLTGIEQEAKSVAATGAQACTWSWTGGTTSQSLCATFKATSAAVKHTLLLLGAGKN